MNGMRTVAWAIIMAGFSMGAACPTYPLSISGTVSFKDPNTRVAGLHLFVRADGRVLAQTMVDKGGCYEIGFTPQDQPSFEFYYAGLGHDTTFIRSFKQFESDRMTWDILLP